MSVVFEPNTYKKLKEMDPAYQAMVRVRDTSNIYDIKQRFIKDTTRNDFVEPLKLFSNNCGLLSDGKYIDLRNFFITPKTITISGKTTTINTPVKYFKFKTNAILNTHNHPKTKDTYIVKTNNENLFSLSHTIDANGNIKYQYGDKQLVQVQYSSEPLQRLDKLSIFEMPALFLYLNGIKIPDNEIFIYASKYWTDVFVPMKYIGDVEASGFYCDYTFNIDFRQPGSEDFYFRSDNFNGGFVNIDLTNEDFHYNSINKSINKDKIIVFNKGKIINIDDVSYLEGTDNKQIHIDFKEPIVGGDIEIYILNDVVYRYNKPETSMLNPNGTKLHFFIDDDYYTNTVSGPITKSAISFFYDGKRIDDTKITQTSRFSFEYDVNISDFDEKLIDYFVEDINWYIDDSKHVIYGDDYYLLNLLGVKRCVDKMKGLPSLSIFDDNNYSISFKKVLSKNGTQFKVQNVIDYYNNLEKNYNTDADRIKKLMTDVPSITRPAFDQFKHKSKKMVILGNEKDVNTSSVYPIVKHDSVIYYKIYLNHLLLGSENYTIERNFDVDIIVINKSCLDPLIKDVDGEIISGINRIELFQYDMTYYERTIFKSKVDGTFSTINNDDGSISYTKVFNFDDLPFGDDFLQDDIVAIEQVKKSWFSASEKEYHLIYPSLEGIGYQMSKGYVITKNEFDRTLTVKITFNHFELVGGEFYLLCKNYNITRSFGYTNDDNSYMYENDLVFPIYSDYVEYTLDPETNKKIISGVVPYFPYINNSEPSISRNGKELIYGKDYTYLTPEKNGAIACSFIVLKSQTNNNSIISCQFNSAKTNILILGYNDLNIDNKYGLLYLSELGYPVSTEYMNIFINGEKLSKFDVDILSDKLIRVHNVYRPIKTVLITTSLIYKESEFEEYVNLYKPSEFELLLENIFSNCDPSKLVNTGKPSIDLTYKNTPDNPMYSINIGFDRYVDSVEQKENPYKDLAASGYNSDVLKVMYMNWLCKSRKTKAYGLRDLNINPIVLKYFSIYNNVVIDNQIDMVIDSSRVYEGLFPDICNPITRYDDDLKPTLVYPGGNISKRREFFYTMIEDIAAKNDDTEIVFTKNDANDVTMIDSLRAHQGAKILYPEDFPLGTDKNGILWTGSNKSYVLN